MKALTLSLLLAAGMLAACGPQETSAQKDNDQINQLIAQQQAIYAPLAGSYVGVQTRSSDGKPQQIQLLLIPMSQPSLNSSRFGTTPVPTVGGYLSLCHDANANCFTDKKLAADNGNKDNAGQFSSATYDPDTHKLSIVMNAGSVTAGSASSTSSNGSELIYIDATVVGGEIKGDIWSTSNLTKQAIDLQKVN